MVKKVRKPARAERESSASPASLLESPLAQSVRASAQQIWLAGMGAFSKAQQGRQKVFESLIKEGTNLQRKTQTAAEDKIGEVSDRMSAMAGGVSAKAGQQWDKIESIFEQRTAKAMSRLGVPTAKDVDALIKRVDELAAAVQRLSKSAPAAAAKKAAAPAKPSRPAGPTARSTAESAAAAGAAVGGPAAPAAAKKSATRVASATPREPNAG